MGRAHPITTPRATVGHLGKIPRLLRTQMCFTEQVSRGEGLLNLGRLVRVGAEIGNERVQVWAVLNDPIEYCIGYRFLHHIH